MQPLLIQLLSGPGAGRRATFTVSPITFGRDADNTLVVIDEFASRRHGELRYVDGQWELANLSANGTRLNRKQVTDKPRPIRSGDTIAIGGQPIFTITLEPATDGGNGEAEGDGKASAAALSPEEIERRKAKRKTVLYVGLGIYLVAFFGFWMFLKTNRPATGPGGITLPKELSQQQIHADILKELKLEPDALMYTERLKQAKELFSRRDDSPGTLYRAHVAFKEALAYSGASQFEGQTQLDFLDVRERLVEKVTRLYHSAYDKLGRGDFAAAATELRELTEIYEDRTSPVVKNAEELLTIAVRELKSKRR